MKTGERVKRFRKGRFCDVISEHAVFSSQPDGVVRRTDRVDLANEGF